jgi:hypothetical protein
LIDSINDSASVHKQCHIILRNTIAHVKKIPKKEQKNISTMSQPILFLTLFFLLIVPTAEAQQRQRDLVTTNTSAYIRGASDDITVAGIGERCNKRQPCADGLTCTRAPSLLGLLTPRSVCFPLDCIATAAQTFNNEVNVTQYHEMIFDKARVTPAEFFMQDKKRHSAFSVAKDMQSSSAVHKVMKTIVENPIPWDTWTAYETSLANCDPQGRLSQSNSWGSGPTTPGAFGTIGIGAEVGAVLGAGVEFWFAFPNAKAPVFFIDLGGGLLAGIDAGVSGIIGAVFTREATDIPGVFFELDLQIPTPIVGPGAAVGVDLRGIWDASFVLNAGVGLAVGGFTAGYTFGIPPGIPPNSTAN